MTATPPGVGAETPETSGTPETPGIAAIAGSHEVPLTRDRPYGIEGIEVAEAPLLAGSICLPDASPASLATLFDTEPARIIGADYPRTLALPTGEVLWTFQDAKMRLADGSIRILHNIGMVQRDNCFDLLRSGTVSEPGPWLFPDDTAERFRWFWPLDAEIGSDGDIYVFAADMRELGEEYLSHTVPVATFVARVDPTTWNVEWYGSPPDASGDLYGWSIASDREWTYLFAQCHRQFGFDPYIFVLAHDRSCTDRVTVARVPKGRLFDRPHYWHGSGWTTQSTRAVPIIDQSDRFASPTQVLFRNNHWVAVTKLDDWWGDEVVVERALRPTGPYLEINRFVVTPKCALDCNTYFSSFVEPAAGSSPDEPLMLSLSHNRWDGVVSSFYRPTFFTIDAPPNVPAAAARCSLDHCT